MYAAASVERAVSRDDVVLQRPEDVRVRVPVFHTWKACAGSASSYILKRIAYRAGAYAPGIQEFVFHELTTQADGSNLERVHNWFNGRVSTLHELGYRLQCRRTCSPTPMLVEWVREGRGHRGAMIPSVYKKLHPGPAAAGTDVPDDIGHAVGITMESADKGDELVMIDPWPGANSDARDRGPISRALESAHRERGFHALAFYWVGWS